MNIALESTSPSLATWLLRTVLFALVWWVLTDGDLTSWPVGVPVVLLSTVVSVILMPPLAWSLRGIVRFIPFFLWYSIRGGIDVARRALHPQLPISPGLIDYRFRLSPGLPRVFMANIVSLLPGTLSVELYEESLRVHVLDKSGTCAEELKMLENRLASIFKVDLVDKVDAQIWG